MPAAVIKENHKGYHKEVAERAIKIIEHFKHSTGEWAGKPFQLLPWQRRPLEKLFGTLNADGTRQYRTYYQEIPRKNGKTELGAGIGTYLLVGDGELGAQIYSAAGDRAQASLVYNAVEPMVRQSPVLMQRLVIIGSQKRIVYHASNSFYQVLSAEAYSKHGINAHGILFDELHTQPNRELWDVLRTSTGARRQPLTVVMTTAGYDRNSIAWEIHDYACKVRDGVIKDNTFLPVIYAAPDDADWTDEDVWKSCNPALGTFRSLDEMRMMCKQAKEMPGFEMAFRRLYLNQWVNSVERWMPINKWDECNGHINIEELRGHPCYGGLDLSATTDLTALALVFPLGEKEFAVMVDFWIPEETMLEKERKDRVPYSLWVKQGYVHVTPGNVIDYDFIVKTIEQKLGLYDIREIAFDRWGSQKVMTDLQDIGFEADPKVPGRHLVAFGQGYTSMSSPTKELMTLVLQKKIIHNFNPVLRWNVDNLVVSYDPAGNIKPDKSKSTQKIDGAIAMIMALDRALRHSNENRSIYEERGPLIF